MHCCPCPPAAQRTKANAPAATGSSATVLLNRKRKKQKKNQPIQSNFLIQKKQKMKKLTLFPFMALLVFGMANAQKSGSIQDLIKQSDLVLEGEVVNKESKWSPDRAFIYTENLVRVDKLYKGQLLDTLVSIVTKGGLVGDELQIHTHYASVPKGQIGIFYLSQEMELPDRHELFSLVQEENGFQKIEDKKLNPHIILSDGSKMHYKKLVETILLQTKRPILTGGAEAICPP